jgi:hypothetical protein
MVINVPPATATLKSSLATSPRYSGWVLERTSALACRESPQARDARRADNQHIRAPRITRLSALGHALEKSIKARTVGVPFPVVATTCYILPEISVY